jgi:small subunit ribosomal protein S17
MPKHKLTGTIISHKMEKTAAVLVERVISHPRYKKKMRIAKKYQAHDPADKYQVGDKVVIEECRPLSKNKKWRIIQKVCNPVYRN